MSNTVLVIDDVDKVLLTGLTDIGFEVNYLPMADRNDLLHHIPNCIGLVVRTKTIINQEVIDKGVKLKFIARAGAGVDNINQLYAAQKGITVFNAGEANADAVGEHTLGLILSLFAKINIADAQVRQSIWQREQNRGIELAGKTVGIIGFGHTGKAVAQKLSGFNVNVLVYDKYLTAYGNQFAQEASLTSMFKQVDLLTVHIPLNDENKYLVNQSFINAFKKNIWLINVSRGQVVNTADVIEAMECGKIVGFGVDVLENEKLDSLSIIQQQQFNYLINSNKTVITPHVAGWTKESYSKISEVLLSKIKDLNIKLSSN